MPPLAVRTVLWKGSVNDRPVAESDFDVVDAAPLDPDTLPAGTALVKVIAVSPDPYMRGRMRDLKVSYFVGPFQKGQPIDGGGVGVVVAAAPGAPVKAGDVVSGMLPWSTHAVVDAAALRSIDAAAAVPRGVPGASLSWLLGPLGMPGLTAWASLKKIAEPIAEGSTAFVSGAAGAVGLVAVQLLKHKYKCAKVIGSAGSDEKVALLKSLGVEAFNYKTSDTEKELAKAGPINVYFDNVGGETLQAALDHMENHGVIVACGSISGYDLPEEKRPAVRNLFNIVTKRVKFQGFIVSDYFAELMGEFQAEMAQFVAGGKVKVFETVTEGGPDAAPKAFVGMMRGENTGKAVVRFAADP